MALVCDQKGEDAVGGGQGSRILLRQRGISHLRRGERGLHRALDSAFIDAVAKPQGLISEMEKDIGRYAGGLDLSDDGDRQRGKAAVWMLKNKLEPVIKEKPFFLSAYFASFDESAHQHGVYSREAAASHYRG